MAPQTVPDFETYLFVNYLYVQGGTDRLKRIRFGKLVVYMPCRGVVGRQVFDCFPEKIMPAQGVQRAVAQVVGLAEKDAQARQPFNRLPQFGFQLQVVH